MVKQYSQIFRSPGEDKVNPGCVLGKPDMKMQRNGLFQFASGHLRRDVKTRASVLDGCFAPSECFWTSGRFWRGVVTRQLLRGTDLQTIK